MWPACWLIDLHDVLVACRSWFESNKKATSNSRSSTPVRSHTSHAHSPASANDAALSHCRNSARRLSFKVPQHSDVVVVRRRRTVVRRRRRTSSYVVVVVVVYLLRLLHPAQHVPGHHQRHVRRCQDRPGWSAERVRDGRLFQEGEYGAVVTLQNGDMYQVSWVWVSQPAMERIIYSTHTYTFRR